MPFINISSQTSLLNPANFLVFALYDASAPSVLLESQAPAKPYGNPLQVTFAHNCINGHVYIFELWESIDSTPTGAVRNSMNVVVNGNTVTVRTDEYLQADITAGMVSGTNTFDKADYAGWYYDIERIGQGTMTPNFAPDITQPMYQRTNTDNSANDLGSKITLLTTGDTWQPGEKFVVRFLPQVVVAPPPGTPSGLFGSGRVIDADENLTSADLGNALLLQSASSTLNIGLPSLALVADFSFIYLFSTGGNQINASITADGTDTILYPTGLPGVILGQCETAILYKAFGTWNVLGDLNGVKMVGELLYNYGLTDINTLLCAGQLLQRAEYPRLWAWVNALPTGIVVTDAAWTGTFVSQNGVNVYTKKSCFSTGNGSTTFRLPLLTNSFLKGIDGSSRLPASIELGQNMQHGHRLITGGSPGSGGGTGSLVRQNYNGDPYSGAGLGTSSLGPYVEVVGGVKNLVENTGAYLLIRI